MTVSAPVEFHAFQRSRNPRLELSCERCGRLKAHEVHVSLLQRVVALRERYLAGAMDVHDFAVGLPDPWEMQRVDDPDDEGKHLALRLLGFLAEYQRGDRSEHNLRVMIEQTR